MAKKISTVDEYITASDASLQQALQVLREIILTSTPAGTKEIIAYNMPTYHHNGNLIHFALNKNHIGIYPGSAAIKAFADELKGYKTSKGAIQLPLDQSIPKELITALISYNLDLQKDKKITNWEKYKDKWLDCEDVMNKIIVKTNLVKTYKWGSDIYTFNNKNVIGWHGFKDFFSLWFYNGVFLNDKDQVLISASDGKTKGLRQWRFTDANQMDESKILSYIQESIQAILDGKEIKAEKSTFKKPDGLLKEALEIDTSFSEAFYKLTPGRQKDYINYIDEAKQDKTKINRIDKIKPLILSGVGLHDKYKK